MIRYNLRYRGPFEYEKFILNIFQLSNEIKYLNNEIETGELNLLSSDNNDLSKLFEELTGEDGLMNKMLKLTLSMEEGTTA